MKTPIFRLAVMALFLGACTTSPGGPDYTELGIRSFDGGIELANECTPLPVLPGGTVVQDFPLAPGLHAHVLAIREGATVTLRGLDDPSSARQGFTQAVLSDGFGEALDVTVAGVPFTIQFSSACDPFPAE